MDIANVLLLKQDLDSYSNVDLHTIAKHRGLRADSRDDLVWVTAIDILRGHTRVAANMVTDDEDESQTPLPSPLPVAPGPSAPRSVTPPVTPSARLSTPSAPAPVRTRARTTGGIGLRQAMFKPSPSKHGVATFAQKYNQQADECSWPTTSHMAPNSVKDCEFPVVPQGKMQYGEQIYELVTLPKGSEIYHGVKKKMEPPQGPGDWSQSKQPMTWFASTYLHTRPLEPTAVFKATVKEDMTLVYIHNLVTDLDVDAGFAFRPILLSMAEKIRVKSGGKLIIDGYVGCNECELGILRQALDKLDYPPQQMAGFGVL